jgi:hypothetical protein
MFNFDDEMWFDGITKYLAQFFNVVVSTDYASVIRLRNLGKPSYFFIPCYNSHIFKRSKRQGNTLYEAGFVGNVFKADRLEYLTFLAERGIRLNVCGLHRNNTWLSYDSMIKMFQATKINLSFTKAGDDKLKLVSDNSPNGLYRQLKGRIFEIMLSGGFCLTEHAVPLEELFNIGKELETFEEKEECFEKIRFYLSRETLRKKIAEAGMLKAQKVCDVRTVIPELWKFISEQYENNKGKNIKYPLSCEFKKRYFAFRMAAVAFPHLWRYPLKLLQEMVMEAKYGKISPILTTKLVFRRELKTGKSSPYKERLFSKLEKLATFSTEV